MVITTTLTGGAVPAAASAPKLAKRKRAIHRNTERQPGIGKRIISHVRVLSRRDSHRECANLSDREGPVCTGNLLPDFAQHRTGAAQKTSPAECLSHND